jgi:beta-lactamase class A
VDKKRSVISRRSTHKTTERTSCKPKKANQAPVSRTSTNARQSPQQFASKPQNKPNVPKNSHKTTSSFSKKRLETKTNSKSSYHRKGVISPTNQTDSLSVLLLSAVRFAVIVVGISTILGTVIAVASTLNSPLTKESNPSPENLQAANAENQKQLETLLPNVVLGKELTSLKNKLQTLAGQYPQLEPGIFLIDLDDNSYLSIQGAAAFASASTIKLPILVAFFQDLDQGKIHLEEKLTMSEDVIAGGSGSMQYEKPGTQYTALEVATKMMTISDNTATNMLIKRMGGAEQLNQRFLEWGLAETALRNPLPDLEGTNTTSPEDLGNLLVNIERGKLISLKSRDRLLLIMRNIVRNTLLPQGLEADAIIAHKTGDIRSVLGDAGIIDMPNGKRYVASVLVKRPDNDPKAKEFIQKMSQVAYQHLKWQDSSSFNQERFLE